MTNIFERDVRRMEEELEKMYGVKRDAIYNINKRHEALRDVLNSVDKVAVEFEEMTTKEEYADITEMRLAQEKASNDLDDLLADLANL